MNPVVYKYWYLILTNSWNFTYIYERQLQGHFLHCATTHSSNCNFVNKWQMHWSSKLKYCKLKCEPNHDQSVIVGCDFCCCFFPTYYLTQQQGSSGSRGEVVVEGQGGGWRAAVWSWGAPVGRHHSVSLHAALTGTVTPSGCWSLWQRNFLSGAPPRTSSWLQQKRKKMLICANTQDSWDVQEKTSDFRHLYFHQCPCFHGHSCFLLFFFMQLCNCYFS